MKYLPKIDYIKKLKEEQEENKDFKLKVKLLAQKYEISEREVMQMITS